MPRIVDRGCWVFNCTVPTRLTRDYLQVVTGELVFGGHHDLSLRFHLLTSDEVINFMTELGRRSKPITGRETTSP